MALKIGKSILNGPKTKLLVLPREEGDLVFKFVAVTDDTEFDVLCPEPTPPRITKVGEGTVEDTANPKYLEQLAEHNSKRMAWYLLQSIKPSEIEWQTVVMTDHNTWLNWRKELTDAGLSKREQDAVFVAFMDTNTVNEAMVEEARKRFLASQQELQSEKQ